MFYLGLKMLLSAAMVLIVTLVAERKSSRFAGVLLGFPLGAGLSLTFLAIEQGPAFAAESARWTMQGIIATLIFCRVYLAAARLLQSRNTAGDTAIFGCVFAGLAGFMAASLLLRFLPQTAWLRLSLVAMVLAAATLNFRYLAGTGIKRHVRLTPLILLLRSAFAALVIAGITWMASAVGTSWSGIFTAFPTAILPSVVVLHHHYGSAALGPLFRELPQGMLAIIVFGGVVWLMLPTFGVYAGIAGAYLAAAIYLLVYEVWLRRLINRLLPGPDPC